jgi:hypothetical protein
MFVWAIVLFMLSFDIAMPIALFVVTLVAMLLYRRIEDKLKTTFEEREFRRRDAILFVVMISVAVSVIVFIPQMAILALFLFSYSTLLFTFSYVFSDMRKKRAQLFSVGFGLASLTAGSVALLISFADRLMFYGGLALLGLAAFAFLTLLLEWRRTYSKARWYLAVLPPVLFILLYFVYNETWLWSPYLFDVFGLVFALLIILYIGTLFTWKATLVFATLLPVADIILVWVTQTMVETAGHILKLGLPIAVALPTFPSVGATILGLGDLFFAGIIVIQMMKKFGKRTAVISAFAMSVALGFFELFILNPSLRAMLPVPALPATLAIFLGWLPVIAWKMLSERKQKQQE